jgi:uncharacterized secreted protein with C-terminal beta-propeller domain
MIKVLLTSALLTYTLVADTTFKLTKGWQFIGFPSTIENIRAFNHSQVDVVWGFDADSQKWLGYAPSKETKEKISAKGYKTLSSIAPWQGVWIHNKEDWVLTLKDEKESDASIRLKKGWNLISLPTDMTISPTIFQNDIVWKYKQKKWQLSQQNSDTSHIAPPISKIDSAEAFWVKSRQDHTVSLSSEASALHTFSSKEAMKSYIKEMALQSYKPRFYDYPIAYTEDGVTYAPELAISNGQATNDGTNTAQKAADTTGTNLQESDVDESDILKHDGEHIFFYDREKNIIRITNFNNLTTAQASTITPITLAQDTHLQAMYIYESKLIMISNKQRYYYAQKVGIPVEGFAPQKDDDISFDVTIYNITNINDITPLSSTNIDGTFKNSRLTNGKLYVISQFSPKLEITYPKIYIDNKKCKQEVPEMLAYVDGTYIPECGWNYQDNGRAYRYDYTKPSIKSAVLIPTINKGERDLITHDTFYAPHKLNQFPTITSISKFDLSSNHFEKSVSTAGYTNALYASSKSIYLTSIQYPHYYGFRDWAERELIYKFDIGEDFDYKAKGFIDGVMLSQYSMSEKGDTLRVASTSGNGWRGNTINSIFTMQTNGNKLEVLGTLTGLGHEGEKIRGVRFVGNRGYVVTFRQTDPLYTIDLHDDAHPLKVGELKVNGFSSYIHPVDENYILTLGRDADAEGRQGGFIIQLFDVSNFAKPRQADIKRYSMAENSFDAEYNPQAFIYRNSDKRFAITYHDNTNSLMDVYQIDTETGTLNTNTQLTITDNAYERRGIIFNLNAQIYSTLFAKDKITTSTLGAAQ